MGTWEPQQTVHVNGSTAYLWVVPDKVPPELKQLSHEEREESGMNDELP
jgi:hypothetical protein